MQVQYEVKEDQVFLNLTAPTTGWLAIGFNTQNDIVGADLKMCRVYQGQVEASDRIVTSRGVYPTDRELAGSHDIGILSGGEWNGHTHISFQVPLQTEDPYDLSLIPGQEVWLILAYSAEDDYDHHSRMREHIRIKL